MKNLLICAFGALFATAVMVACTNPSNKDSKSSQGPEFSHYEVTDSLDSLQIIYQTSFQVPDSIRSTVKKALVAYRKAFHLPRYKELFIFDTFLTGKEWKEKNPEAASYGVNSAKYQYQELILASANTQRITLNTVFLGKPQFAELPLERTIVHELFHTLKPVPSAICKTPYKITDSFTLERTNGLVMYSVEGPRFSLIEEAAADALAIVIYQNAGSNYTIVSPEYGRIAFLFANIMWAQWFYPQDVANAASTNQLISLASLMVNKPKEKFSVKDLAFLKKIFQDVYDNNLPLGKALETMIKYRGENPKDYVIPKDMKEKNLLRRK